MNKKLLDKLKRKKEAYRGWKEGRTGSLGGIQRNCLSSRRSV